MGLVRVKMRIVKLIDNLICCKLMRAMVKLIKVSYSCRWGWN